MIVTLEGPSCSGKTTLACALRAAFPGAAHVGWSVPHDNGARRAARPGAEGREATLQAEYARLRTIQTVSVDEELDLQRQYLDLVRVRISAIRAAAEDGNIVIADRDMWSFFAHGWARFQGPYQSGRGTFGALFADLAKCGPHTAHLTVVLEVPHTVWSVRAARRAQRPHPLLFDPAFYGALQGGYREASRLLGEAVMVLDGDTPLEALTEQVCEGIQARRHRAPMDARAILAEASRLLREGTNERL